jgi:hypothetical protein
MIYDRMNGEYEKYAQFFKALSDREDRTADRYVINARSFNVAFTTSSIFAHLIIEHFSGRFDLRFDRTVPVIQAATACVPRPYRMYA